MPFVRLLAACALLFLWLPILAIIPISFSSGSFLSYPMPGFSLRWYAAVLQPDPWLAAFRNSLQVGIGTMVLSTTLGTMAAYGLNLTQGRCRSAVLAFLISPMIVPVVIIALSSYFALAYVGGLGSLNALVLAHTLLASPFVLILVLASLGQFDHTLSRAASSLGASPIATFKQVTLPLIWPGIFGGATFAFVTSFDEVVIAMFVTAPGQVTVPRQLFAGLRDKIDPSLVAVTTVLIAFSIIFFALLEVINSVSRSRTSRS